LPRTVGADGRPISRNPKEETMHPRKLLCFVLFAPLMNLAHAQPADAQSLLKKCDEVRAQRLAGVSHYVVDKSMMGQRVTIPYERVEVPGRDGSVSATFRQSRRSGPASGSQSSDDLRLFAQGFGQGAEMVGTGLAQEMEAAGFPPGMFGGAGQDPWASTDPREMMGGVSTFVNAAADAQDENERERQASAARAGQSMADKARVYSSARLVGIEKVNGRSAYHLKAEGLNQASAAEGQQMVLDTVNLWIDTEKCVPLKTTMHGVATEGGNSRPVTIERLDSDYRTIPGSRMYEPFRQVMRMQGTMTAEQERETRDAQQKLEQTERQLEQLPPAQRQMIMAQMGPQMAMMRKMASGGGVEVVTEVHAIVVNPDAAALEKLRASASAGPGAGMFAGAMPPAGGAPVVGSAPAAPLHAAAPLPEASAEAQQACLKEKIRQRQQAQQTQRGMGSLMGAVGRLAGRFGVPEVSQAIGDARLANATAEDLASAARDLGLTENEIADCRTAG
jgi:hypothetical protein